MLLSNFSYSKNLKPFLFYEYNHRNLLSFISYLISNAQYYRANVELMRLQSYYPGYIDKKKLHITEIYLLFNGKKYDAILKKKPKFLNKDYLYIDSIFKIDSYLYKSKYQTSNFILSSLNYPENNKDLDIYLYKRAFITSILLKDLKKAKEITIDLKNKIKDSSINYSKYNELINHCETNYALLKKPYDALFLGFFPGMGYIYSDEKPTGILAFIIVTVFSTLSYFSFKTNNYPLGICIGTASSFLYGGNIIGGYFASKKYNNIMIKNLKKDLLEEMDLNTDREKIYIKFGLTNVN